MAKVDLPSGGWAMLVDVDTVTSGQRKALLRASKGTDDPFDLNDGMVSRLVLAWSYDDIDVPTPEKPESLDEIPFADADALTKACIDIVKALTPDFDPNPDPGTPTGPSDA